MSVLSNRAWYSGFRTLSITLSLVVAAGIGSMSQARGGATDDTVALAELPVEAQASHRLILVGGPFPHDKDGMSFGNRERLLPARARGYYREYTVATKGARDRGARRLVCGGPRPAKPDACYYTDDHYASFRRVLP